eukprot:4785079-Amphidinium_carterae.4
MDPQVEATVGGQDMLAFHKVAAALTQTFPQYHPFFQEVWQRAKEGFEAANPPVLQEPPPVDERPIQTTGSRKRPPGCGPWDTQRSQEEVEELVDTPQMPPPGAEGVQPMEQDEAETPVPPQRASSVGGRPQQDAPEASAAWVSLRERTCNTGARKGHHRRSQCSGAQTLYCGKIATQICLQVAQSMYT